jgi:hypothetical protein
MSMRLGQLNKLAAAIPMANQQIASGMQQARETQLQQSIGQMTPEQAATPRLAQSMGAQQAAQASAIQLGAQQKTQQSAVVAGQQAIVQDKIQKQQELFTRSQALSQKNRYLENELARISQSAKDKLLDQQLSFKRDELGRTIWNERQLADYKIATAKDEEDFRNYQQEASNLSERRMKMLQMAQRKLEQVLEQGYISTNQKLDQASRLKIVETVAALKRKQARESARQSSNMGMWAGAGTVVGAVAGAMIAGPTGYAAGAAVGAQIGQGVGTAAGAQNT